MTEMTAPGTADGPRPVALRPARPSDLEAIVALLSAADLPTRGVAEQLDTFVVAEAGDTLVGVGGIEWHGAYALLRSLAVCAQHRGRGVASAICDYLEDEAVQRDVTDIYVLTETAEKFFMDRHYVVEPRSRAPAAIAASEEFAAICPQSATLMHRVCVPEHAR
jgi:amino-acid N-acetyltransferase